MTKASCLAALLLCLCASFTSRAQNIIRGDVKDASGKPLKGIAVSLLYPTDSTLASFGITDGDGRYVIQSVANGSYLLQASGMNYKTHYQPVAAPVSSGGTLPSITLQA